MCSRGPVVMVPGRRSGRDDQERAGADQSDRKGPENEADDDQNSANNLEHFADNCSRKYVLTLNTASRK